MKKISLLLTALTTWSASALAIDNTKSDLIITKPSTIEERVTQEKAQTDSLFLISTYKPNYILPFYYNSAVVDPTTSQNTSNHNPKHEEIKFQLSFKFPVVGHFFSNKSTLYAAYSQLSFWQAYTNSPYFRETNYEPELFLANNLNISLANNWKLNFLNLGVNHESNGRGGELERSWNRVYLEAIVADDDWMISIKPWYISHDSSLSHNPDIAGYLGHEKIVVAYKYHENVFSIEKTNIEKGFSRGAIQLTWSFPLTKKTKGYIQYFNGYGQSLIEYNHNTSSAGIGIALNDWI